jgi:hypothetical protein
MTGFGAFATLSQRRVRTRFLTFAIRPGRAISGHSSGTFFRTATNHTWLGLHPSGIKNR